MIKILKNFIKYILVTIIILIIVWFSLDIFNLNKFKNNFIDTFLPSSQYIQLKKDFENDSSWNIEKDANIKELNFARYSAFHQKLNIYMQHSLPHKEIQKNTLNLIDQTGIIYNGDNTIKGNVKQLFPLKFNYEIYNLAKEYAKSGAVDQSNLIHSPSNPNFAGSDASEEHPNFSKWYISDYIQVRKESIATGYNKLSDTIKGWIGEDDNIEQDKQSVLGHRLHILDVDKNILYGGIAKSTKTGWVMHTGIVMDTSWKTLSECNFIDLDKFNFTYKKETNDEISSYYPAQHKILKFNPNVCNGITIKAYYPSDLNTPLSSNTMLNQNETSIIFKQEANPGYVLKDAKNIDAIQVQIIK